MRQPRFEQQIFLEMATQFIVHASAGKGSFSLSILSKKPLVLKAGIPAQAEHGEANRALLLELERAIGAKVQLLAGKTSRRKLVAADCGEERIVEAIQSQTQKR